MRSVLSLWDWSEEEVRIRVEAAETVHGLWIVVIVVSKELRAVEDGVKTGGRSSSRLYFSEWCRR